MKLRYFNLKDAQEKLFSSKSKSTTFNRRSFIKTGGLGAIALTPIVNVADKLGNTISKPFTIKATDKGFVVKRRDKTCWKFPSPQFEKDVNISLSQNDNNYKLNIKNIRWRGSLESFNLYAEIYYDIFGWRMRIEIPEFNVKESIDFIDWLDGSRLLESQANVDLRFGQDNVSNSIIVRGDTLFKMDNKWNIIFEGDNIAKLKYLNEEYLSSSVVLCNKGISHQSFITAPSQSLRIILPKFDNLNQFLSDIRFEDNYALNHRGEKPDLNCLVRDDRMGTHHQSLWINYKGDGSSFSQENNKFFNLKLSSLFFISETNGTKEPEIYLAAATSPNQWISNEIGSFNINARGGAPDLQASGAGNRISGLRYSTHLSAFKPIVRNAVTMTTIMDKPKDILIAEYGYNESLFDENQVPIKIKSTSKKIQSTTVAPQDTTKKKSTINLKSTAVIKESSNQIIKTNVELKDTTKGKLNIKEADKIVISDISLESLVPKELLFRIVRPEDMLILDFEFKNFVINKSSANSLLAIKDNKKPGLMIVRIQSQHTLEEAFFENNNIPNNESTRTNPIKIPVKHIRANRSRLVFEYPSKGKPFGLNINELMDWSKFELRTNPRAWVTEEKKTGTILAPILGSRSNITIPKSTY